MSAEQIRDLTEFIDQRISHALCNMSHPSSVADTPSRTHTRTSSLSRSVTDERPTERKSKPSHGRYVKVKMGDGTLLQYTHDD